MEAGMNRAMRIKRGLASARFGGRRAPFKSPCGRTGPMHGIAWQAVDGALATLSRLRLPDSTEGIMAYVNSVQDDGWQKQRIYRRDVFYAVNYPTVQTQTYPVIRHV